MSPATFPALSSVRVRITAFAAFVTAVALAVGGFALLRSVEDTQLGRIERSIERRLDAVVERLEAGADPATILGPGESAFGFVQVLDANGDVLVASPGPFEQALVLVSPSGVAQASVSGGAIAVGFPPEGGGRIEEAIPGTAGAAFPIEVRYRTIDAPDGTFTIVSASPVDEVQRSLDALRRSLLVGLPLLVLLVGGVAWVVVGRALHPVEAMRAEAEAITASTLHRRVPEPSTDDEVGRLARTMNAMLDRLEAGSERQRQFVADASHELRSPVAAIRAQLEVALRRGDEPALRSAAEAALIEEARLEALLSDLLLLASVDEGAPAGGGDVDLAAVAVAEAARPRRVPVVVSGRGVARGSTPQLRRVVANLVDNAARHAATSVEVDVATAGGRAVFVVDDDGAGIPADERERVFERFTRLDAGRARDDGGAGLGLAIVRAIVDRHGGRVAIDDAPSGGTRVIVDLPGSVLPAGTDRSGGRVG